MIEASKRVKNENFGRKPVVEKVLLTSRFSIASKY